MTKGEQQGIKINCANVEVYEMGSTFQGDLHLDGAPISGKVNLGSRVDARDSLRAADASAICMTFMPRIIWTVLEVFTHSPNIGTARSGADGRRPAAHQAFLRKMGQLDRLRTELPERGTLGAQTLTESEHDDRSPGQAS